MEQDPNDDVSIIQLEMMQNGEVINEENIEDFILNINVTNTTKETLEIGSLIDNERYHGGSREKVEPPENWTEEAELLHFYPEENTDYSIPVQERFLENDDLIGGTYRLNNNNTYFAYFFVAEFSNSIK